MEVLLKAHKMEIFSALISLKAESWYYISIPAHATLELQSWEVLEKHGFITMEKFLALT